MRFLIIYILLIILMQSVLAEVSIKIPADRILEEQELLDYLRKDIPELVDVYAAEKRNEIEQALQLLARYFREKAATRYYFNWKQFAVRFKKYHELFPEKQKVHHNLAEEQTTTYSAETHWQLPFKNLLGNDVTAYELRHLARQQKSFDMAMLYYYSGGDNKYLDYFVRQVADLNRAFIENEYDDAGNGVYESFRAGKRIHNWLFCYNAYLASSDFEEQDILLLIRTFLHHGAQLENRTKKIRYGNHHTKGLAALFEIASQFPEFSLTEQWMDQALTGAEWHLKNEVNSDGFQFERSVHYHKSDIENYLRIYLLSRRNNLQLSDLFEGQFRKMFDVLVKIAQPDRHLPVLQDDTDLPFREKNPMDEVMMVGTIIFRDSTFRYFTSGKILPDYYWFFNEAELNNLDDIQSREPAIGSVSLSSTGYYVMRNGWNDDDAYMIISAGLSEQKPDHQHGEMLGVVAYANSEQILPTYQVKYNLPDYAFWKNSWVKNVALVESIPLGRGWTPNRGGSGFGKWANLPHPEVKAWITDNQFDYFCGSHDSYDSLGVTYFREVIFIKDGFWIIRDHFKSKGTHHYQQIWQGIYEVSGLDRIHRDFKSGSTLDIVQLNSDSLSVHQKTFSQKGCSYFQTFPASSYVFTTLVYPYEGKTSIFQNIKKQLCLKGEWNMVFNEPQAGTEKLDMQTDAEISMSSVSGRTLLMDMNMLQLKGLIINLREKASLMVSHTGEMLELWYLGVENNKIILEGESNIPDEKRSEALSPGQHLRIMIKKSHD